MQSLRLERIEREARVKFPPPARTGTIRVVKIFSDRALTDEEIDARAAKIPGKPNEHRILLNVVKVTSRRREAVAEDVEVKGKRAPAAAETSTEERALEAEVRRLERRKAELLAAGKTEGKAAELERRSRRVDEVKRAARNAEDRARRKI